MSTFRARRAIRTGTVRIAVAPHRAFDLFSPLGEKHWVAGWDPELLHPASGDPEVGAVFATQHHDGLRAVWTIIAMEPSARHIAYVNVTADTYLALIDVRCQADPGGGTCATVTYTYTGLSEHGNRYIESLTEADYRDRMASWEEAIGNYLQYGGAHSHLFQATSGRVCRRMPAPGVPSTPKGVPSRSTSGPKTGRDSAPDARDVLP